MEIKQEIKASNVEREKTYKCDKERKDVNK